MGRKPITTDKESSTLTQSPNTLKSIRTGNQEGQTHEAGPSQ